MSMTLAIALLGLACTSGECTGETCDSGTAPASCDVAVDSVSTSPVDRSPQVRDLTVSMTARADLAVTCSQGGGDPETLLFEVAGVTDTELLLAGLMPESTYRCTATPVCGELTGEARDFSFDTDQRTGAFPELSVTGDPGQRFFLVNHARFCDKSMPMRLLLVDAAGQIRWSFDDIPGAVSVSIGHQYLGDGVFFWGGGESEQGDPTLVDLRQQIVQTFAWEGSDTYSWHHEARIYDNGRLLTMNESTNGSGRSEWRGFNLTLFDTATEQVEWTWDSQSGVDQGLLPAGVGDVYHSNWAGVDQDARRAFVSLCTQEQVIGIDMDTGDIVWTFGKDGDFDLVDPSGAALPITDLPQCQHGLEVQDQTLLFYDNGGSREQSRIAEYTLDFASSTATLNWSWTEDGFYEPALGDADYLDDGTVLAGRGHVECVDGTPGAVSKLQGVDPETGTSPWSLSFTDSQDTTYRAGVAEVCDVIPSSLYCPGIAERLAALGLE